MRLGGGRDGDPEKGQEGRGTRGSEKKEDREDVVGGNGGVKEGDEEEEFAKFLFLGRRGTKERLENMCACANPEAGYEMSEHSTAWACKRRGRICLPLLTK